MDRFDEGNIVAYASESGSVRLEVTAGPLRVTPLLVDQADPEWLSRAEDLLTFHSLEADGSRRAYRYRIVGTEPGVIEGGWLLCEPVA